MISLAETNDISPERKEKAVSPPNDLAYRLNDFPPWPKTLLYGLQWTLIFLPTLVLISGISVNYLGFREKEAVLFFQRTLLITGGMMILQTLWGHRLPLLDGPSSALLLSFVIFAPQGLPAIQGGMLAGGLFLVLLSALGLMRRLERLFTDNVVGVILILIAVTLLPYLSPMLIQTRPGRPGDPFVFCVSLIVIMAIAFFSHRLRGFPKTISLFLGIILGTLLLALGGRAALPEMANAPWFSIPTPFFPGLPEFSLVTSLSFFIAYLAVIVNGVGSIYSVSEIVGKSGMERKVTRGIALTGVGGSWREDAAGSEP